MWIVRLTEQHATYGPFDDRASAERFRSSLGQPGVSEQLHDPITELLDQIAAMWTGEQVPARPTWQGGPAWGPTAEAAYREKQSARPSVRGGAQLNPADEDGYREEQGT